MDKILLAHGGGGSKSAELTRRVFQRYLRDPLLMEMDDAARLPGQVFTTDRDFLIYRRKGRHVIPLLSPFSS